jgi:hypothetical protein
VPLVTTKPFPFALNVIDLKKIAFQTKRVNLYVNYVVANLGYAVNAENLFPPDVAGSASHAVP